MVMFGTFVQLLLYCGDVYSFHAMLTTMASDATIVIIEPVTSAAAAALLLQETCLVFITRLVAFQQ
uniref:Uncharacterized protein n=1 Tax=Arundo donax TaxID=35708 RepID=A0A0A9HKU2_ARUDO